MIVKKYTGSTETDAIMKAKEELGSNAVVLNVKKMQPRGIARIFKKEYVEITAALEENDFAQTINNRKPAAPNMSQEPAKKSTINLVADDNVSNNTSAAIEKKLDNIHEMIRNQIREEHENSKETKEIQETVAKELEKAEAEKSIIQKANNINYKSLKLIYNKLIDNEVDEKYANTIINDIESSLKKESNLDSILASVYQKIILKLGEPAAIDVESSGKKKVVFFIGPTGVGKTTTIAKLASDMTLNNNKSVGMITADTYRIAAVEQLNTYADILEIPIRVIYSPSEILDGIRDVYDNDIIMIDTAGRSHKNTVQRQEIIDMIHDTIESDLDVDVEIYLVLSVTTKYKDLLSIVDAYKEIEGFNLIFTKLDETTSLGNILNIRWYTDARLSYTTIGQNVPSDIERIDVQKIAKQLLGGNEQ